MSVLLVQGDARAIPLADESVHTICTSPPYWNLRNYSTLGQIGLEASVDEYIDTLVQVFREVYRVLVPTGLAFVNMGDTYQDKQLMGIPWRLALAMQQPYAHHVIQRPEDRAWLAGLVDGEGTISIARYVTRTHGRKDAPRCQDGFSPLLSIGNNDRELLDKCVEITGYGSVKIKDARGMDRRGIRSRRIYHGWRLDAGKAIAVIRDIYPYLVSKQQQAILAYTLDCSNKQGKKLRGWQQALPAAEQEKRVELKRLVNACNQRQPVTLPSYCIEPTVKTEPGWILRSEIIWHKLNPMPESVQDRPTRAHEQVFLFSKQGRYFFDMEAVRESYTGHRDYTQPLHHPGNKHAVPLTAHFDGHAWNMHHGGRAMRSVLSLASEPCHFAHFATMPTELVRRCLLAGAPTMVCAQCQAPFVRQVSRQRLLDGHIPVSGTFSRPEEPFRIPPNGVGHYRYTTQTTEHGFAPTCHCGAPGNGKAVVLDPFCGSGTTLLVARELGHHGVGLDLSYPYLHAIARERLGLAALHRWEHGAAAVPATFTDLPLFATEDTLSTTP